MLDIVGTSFIDINDIYCFRTGLSISKYKDVCQYWHLSKTVNLYCTYLK